MYAYTPRVCMYVCVCQYFFEVCLRFADVYIALAVLGLFCLQQEVEDAKYGQVLKIGAFFPYQLVHFFKSCLYLSFTKWLEGALNLPNREPPPLLQLIYLICEFHFTFYLPKKNCSISFIQVYLGFYFYHSTSLDL